jgi:hypothetical protein
VALLAGAAFAVGAPLVHAEPTGVFSAPFAEPTIDGERTDFKCIRRQPRPGREASGPLYTPLWDCKPTAGSVNISAVEDPSGTQRNDDRVVYWNALESTENNNGLNGGEYGFTAVNDQTRRMDLNGLNPFESRWAKPDPVDGNAYGDDATGDPDKEFLLIPDEEGQKLDPPWNDSSLFCADNNFLPDGRILAVGGSIYKNDPPAPPVGENRWGQLEVQGSRKSRIYNPWTNRWQATPKMHYGRWYPTMVTLGSRGDRAGDTFVASGVKNLNKYYDEQFDPSDPDQEDSTRYNRSGDNVNETEVRDWQSGKWELQGPEETQDPSDRPLPLFPRLHLLPNGHVYYNAQGQTYNPNGGSYNEATWNVAAAFDPATRKWNELGVPGTTPDGPPDPFPGFRGSTFSVMLPLKPEEGYSKARFLTGGGVLGTTPGTYLAIDDSRIDTVDSGTSSEGSPAGTLKTHAVGKLNEPRWYGQGTLLPTGEVLVTSGAREDETLAPGSETPVKHAEIFDPETETWRRDAEANRLRTYHNTAALLHDGRVLVGGHAPLPGGNAMRNIVPQDPQHPNRPYAGGTPYNQPSSQNDGRDPTFEIYTPPYLRTGEPQPNKPAVARCWTDYDDFQRIGLNYPASEVDRVVLVRNPALTHIQDGDQRNVELPIVERDGNSIKVKRPPNANVAPPGPYMLFVNRRTARGSIPSKSAQIFIGLRSCRAPDEGQSREEAHYDNDRGPRG